MRRSDPVVVEGLTKVYRGRSGEVVALNDVSFSVRGGEVFGVLGPNGAGKTTLSLIIAGLLEPTRGTAYVMGEDVRKLKRKVCEKYVALYLSGYMRLVQSFLRVPALKYLIMVGSIHWARGDLRRRAEEALKLVGLWEWRSEWPSRFSSGMRRRLMIAEILLYDMPILVLDEPTVHMDPASCMEVWRVLKKVAREEGRTILLTTQNMEEAEYLCDRILFLNRGRVVAIATPHELRELVVKRERIVVALRRGDGGRLVEKLRDLPAVFHAEAREGGRLIVIEAAKDGVAPAELIDLAAKLGCEVRYLSYEKPSLSDVFRALVGGGAA